MVSKGPELRPQTSVAGLYLVGDIQPAGGMGLLDEQAELGLTRRVDTVAHE